MALLTNAAGLEVNGIVTPGVPRAFTVVCTTANTNYAAPTNTQRVAVAGAKGGRLTKLKAIPQATVSATQLQEFRSADAGVTKRFSNAVIGAAGGYTMAATTQPPIADFGYSDESPKKLAADEEIWVAVGVTGTWTFEAEWDDYT